LTIFKLSVVFEAAGAVVKIGSSLYQTTIRKILEKFGIKIPEYLSTIKNSGVNFTNVLLAAFMLIGPKSAK
jgi:hypothetical protein